jgi:hypothetical protein
MQLANKQLFGRPPPICANAQRVPFFPVYKGLLLLL